MLTVDKEFLKQLHASKARSGPLNKSVIDDLTNDFVPNRPWAREKISKFLTQLKQQTGPK